MGLGASSERRPVFYFVGDSITEFGSNPQDGGFIALLQRDYVRCVDMINRGLAGYNSRWVAQHALPIFDAELAAQYEASFVTLWLGANDAALPDGPNKNQFVPLDEYRTNMTTLTRAFGARLPTGGRLLLITPPAVIDSMRRDKDRSNAAAGEYARACVAIAGAEGVAVLDLHTHFNTTYPDETERRSFFADGLHFNAKGNAEVARLLGDTMKKLFSKEALHRFHHMQLPGWDTWVKSSCDHT
ncbi:hypothetical protein PybrP1_001382 [[Pythium] brassicae (nom. inval.)]|nr:hypothetical protein PybrP1_001382 [[Pythium] brassicae (nom. inval.)]